MLRTILAYLCAGLALVAMAGSAAAKPGVVVLYFSNNTNDPGYDVLQKGLADMMVTDLSVSDRFDVVERDRLDEILDELKLQKSDYFDPKTAVKIGKGIGARYAVAGSLAAIEPKIRIDIRLIDVQTSKILMADKVIGLKDEFFELEALLSSKFLAAIDKKLASGATAVKARNSGVKNLSTVLTYSQAIDSADKGDYQAASKKLAKVVARAPKFTRAQEKYAEVIKRLHEARANRNKILATGEQQLLQNTLDFLKANDLAKLVKNDQVRRYMGYRILLGQYYLWTLGRTLGLSKEQMKSSTNVRAKKALQIEAHRWMRAYYENTLTCIREQKSLEQSRNKRFQRLSGNNYEVSDEDEKRGEAIGIEDPGEWTFAKSWSMARSLGEFVFLGKPGFWTPFSFVVSPPLVELDDSVAEPMLTMLSESLAWIDDAGMDEDMSQRENIRTLDSHAQILMRLGRKMEAVIRWQMILDQYPTYEKYQDIEKNIQDAIGIDETGAADGTLGQLLTKCDPMELINYLTQKQFPQALKTGFDGMMDTVRETHKQCGDNQTFTGMGIGTSFFNVAASLFVNQGACDYARETAKIMSGYPMAEQISGPVNKQISEKCD